MKPCEIDDLTTKLDAARKRHQEHLDKILEAYGESSCEVKEPGETRSRS